MTNEFTVFHNDKPVYKINEHLIDAKNVRHNLEEIIELHEEKLGIYEEIKTTTDIKKLSEYAEILTELEFQLQRLWGFKEDKNYHRFWETPKCTCPKMDNKDDYPYRQHIDGNCPLHGSFQ